MMRPRPWEISLAVVLGLAMLATLLVYGPADQEEYQVGVFSTQVHYQHIVGGSWLFWFNDMGFGTPLPLGHRLDVHPAFLLDPFTSLRVTLSLLWIAHVIVAGVFILRLAAASGMNAPIRVLVLFCYLFSSATVGWFYANDWVTFVVAWTMYPVLVFYLRQVVSGDAVTHYWRAAIRLALLFAFVILNSHPGYVAPLFLVLVIYTVAIAPRQARVYACLFTGLVFCIALCAERLYFFWSEMRQFDPAMQRDNIQAGYVLTDYVRAAVLPLTATVWTALTTSLPYAFAVYVELLGKLRQPFIGFGVLAGAIAAFLPIVWRRRDGARWLDRDWRGYAIAFAAAVALSLISPETLMRAPSGSWLFRDPAVFFAIMASAVVLQRCSWDRRSWSTIIVYSVVVLQICQQLAVAFPAMYLVKARKDYLLFYRYQRQPVGLTASLLRHAEGTGRRIYLSGDVQGLARTHLSAYGLHEVTDLALVGLNPVNGWFKSVSMDRLYPSRTLMHGFIAGEPDVIANQPLLDVLGINLVLAREKTDTPPPGLSVLERIPITTGDGDDVLVVLGNPTAWPHAVLLPPSLAGAHLPRRPACQRGVALCRDYTSMAAARLDDPVTAAAEHGRYTLRMAPAAGERLLFMSVLYRPEWRAVAGDRELQIVPVADAFVGVRVPAGVETIQLTFRPLGRIVLAWFSGITGAALLIALAVLYLRRRP